MVLSKEDIIRRYKTPGHPIAFSAPGAVAKHYPAVTQKRAKEALEHIDTYVLHREFKRPKIFNPYYIYKRRDLVQADLIDISSIKNQNDNVRYLLLIIDVFSRKVWMYPLVNKTKEAMVSKLTHWLAHLDRKPVAFSTDGGTEFWNRPVSTLLRSNNVDQQLAIGTSKASYAERANKTLQILIYKYLTDQETLRYVDVLDQLVSTYNKRGHRSLAQLSPNEADLARNQRRIRDIHMQRYAKVKRKKPTFKLGDMVRIKTESKQIVSSRRAYAEQYHGEYYLIERINRRLPIPLYYLRGMDDGVRIDGGFYANELSKVRGDVFKIERVLQRRGAGRRLQLKVRWKYFGPRWDQWILASDLRAH